MFTRLNNTITNAIENVMDNSVCDFNNWWKDEFETEVYFETEEDLKKLSDTDLEIAKYDWIACRLDGFVSEVCNLLGIEMYNTHSKYHEIILEEIYEIVKDMLFNKINTMKLRTNWILTKSNSDNAEVEFYRFYGSADEVKEKLLLMAQNSDMVKFSEIDDDYPASTDSVQYGIDTDTYLIVINDCYGETDEVYSAKAICDIDELPEEF